MDSTDTDLTTLFAPDSIALIGASGDLSKLSGRPYRFLRKFGYEGDLFLVNPNQDEIDGEICYDSLADVPGQVDVAMVLVSASVVPPVIKECGEAGVRFAIVIASGFKETGAEGRQLEERVAAAARDGGVRLVGPNSEGLVSLADGFVASFSSVFKRDDLQTGGVGFVSQSGAFGGAIFQLMQNLGVGANKWITTGNEADLDAPEVMAHYVEDPAIDVVVTYLESADDGRRLLDIGARAVETDTDVVVMRVGTSAKGQRATESHTGSIATDDAIYNAVIEQAGFTRVWSVSEFADVVSAFSRLPADEYPDPDKGLGVISMSGGAAALIADSCERVGLPLATFDEETRAAIRREIPSYGSTSNPVDVTGAAISDPAVFERCVTVIADDDAVGILLLQYGNSGAETIEVCKETLFDVRSRFELPVAAVFTGSSPSTETTQELLDAGIWTFEDPVRAIKTFGAVSDNARQGRRLSTWNPDWDVLPARVPLPCENWATATEALAGSGITFADSMVARNEAEVVVAAEELGYPLALKLDPIAVSHKSEIGGVTVNLIDEVTLRSAYRDLDAVADQSGIVVQEMVNGVELIVGVIEDPDFGPMLLFGPGGIFVELFEDAFSYRALPVTEVDARKMIAESAGSRLLDGYRDVPPADVDAVASTVAAVSDAYAEYDLSEIELNPVVATPSGCVAVDLLVE